MNAVKQRANEILRRLRGVKDPVVVELGVHTGRLSEALLFGRADLHLVMVDTWQGVDRQPDDYKATKDANALRSEQDALQARRAAIQRTMPYFKRITILEEDSAEAAGKFSEKSCDLVFIDADHSESGVRRDIEAWLPRARLWIGGHDYRNPAEEYDFSGVDRAVDARFPKVQTGANYTWWVRL